MNITDILLKIAHIRELEHAEREAAREHIEKLKHLVHQRHELERLIKSNEN